VSTIGRVSILPAALNRGSWSRELFSKSRAINALSAARLFLFASRDVWFVVGLPIFLSSALGWGQSAVGGFLAA